MSKRLRFYTVKQVADIFKKHIDTIYRWKDDGTIRRVVKIKGGYLIPHSEVDRLIKEGTIINGNEK